jgi:P-type Cu2+ transporter
MSLPKPPSEQVANDVRPEDAQPEPATKSKRPSTPRKPRKPRSSQPAAEPTAPSEQDLASRPAKAPSARPRKPRQSKPAAPLPAKPKRVELPYTEVMPYQPSAPCASCATGVDPLRAACVRITDRGLEFFCSRTCRETQQRAERERAEHIANQAPPALAPEPRTAPRQSSAQPAAPVSEAAPGTRRAMRSLEPVARRIAPSRATTPQWPWLLAALAVGLSFARFPGTMPASALLLTGAAAVFASRSTATREQAGTLGWLAVPLAVAALSLAAVLAHDSRWVVSAAGALLVAWFREHWLERAHALVAALRSELEARSASKVRVWSGGEASHAPRLSDRPLSSLRVGDQVCLEQGAVVPVDGVVEEGEAELLPYPQAQLTEARRAGEAVLAGALLIRGSVRVRATAVGPRRALFRALSMPDRQLENVAPSAQLAMRARALGPGAAVLAVALAAAACAPGSLAAKLASFGAALLALPLLAAARGSLAALQGGVIRASARGVFFRDGAALERAGQVDTAVLRVEGTLVPRTYTLVEVHALSPELDRESLLAWALAVEAAADGHPIARAVRKHAASLGISAPIARRLAYVRGAGVSGLTDGQGALVFGSRAALLQAGVSVAVADREAQLAEQAGHRVVLLALGGHVRGVFVFAQEVRAEARLAVQSLFDLGLEVELVSGDHRNTGEALARTLDVLQLKAELGREQREAELRRLRDGEARVVAIGSAADAGSMLTAADVGVCLEGAPDVHAPGDLRTVAYDVTTASADLCDAAYALSTARESRRALQLVWGLAGAGALLALLGALGVVPAWACVLAALGIDVGCLHPRVLRAPAKSRVLP